MQASIPSHEGGCWRGFYSDGMIVGMLLHGRISLNSQLWNSLYCSAFNERRLFKAKHRSEQVKKERSKHTLENGTNSDGLFIRGKLRRTKLYLLDDGRGRN